MVCAGLSASGAEGVAPNAGSPESFDSAQTTAMQLVQAGRHVDAAALLLNALSAIPPDCADLAPAALGCGQLLLFTNEYLMTDAERQALYAGALDEKNNEMHRFMATLMRYMDDAGISQEEADACARDLQGLTWCRNLPVRIGALFVMSSPYYFKDTPLARQARNQIAAEFPGTYLAREAQRLPLYYARTGGAAALKEVLERTSDDGTLRPDTARTRADRVGGAVYDAIKEAAPEASDAACVAGLASAARDARDWAEEYAALTIAEGFHGGPCGPRVRAMAEESIERDRDPRCTFRARVIRMSVARIQGDTGAVLEDADALLQTDPLPLVIERSNYEELKNSIQQTAEFLIESGQAGSAIDLLERLATRFPNTVLAYKLGVRVAEIEGTAVRGGR